MKAKTAPAHLDRQDEDHLPSAEAADAEPAQDQEYSDTEALDSSSYRPSTLLRIGASAGLLYHRLSYNDDLYGFLRPYQLQNAKVFGAQLELYPFARMDGADILGRFGVELRHRHMLGFDSSRSDGSRFPTRSWEFLAGVRAHLLPVLSGERVRELTLGVGAGAQRFEIDSAIALPNVDNRAAVPSRAYRFVRLDLAGRFELDLGFFLLAHAGVRFVTDAGDIDSASWFPRARRNGIESGLHLGYTLPKNLEISGGFEAQRYFYRTRARPGDANVVGGLVDRFIQAEIRFGWRL